MSDVVIRAENLGKKYKIQHKQQRQQYVSLRDVIAHRAKSLFRKSQFSTVNSQLTEDFWALKDVSFEIKQGEVVGIIGRNGAGKSTLLKILSRITEPTVGRVGIKGRIASLLEVGTGFHPELTGRENIYLNGAILGMSREEIKRKFDEIVAFAEIEKFLDTPVKRYSSGMYIRLAFAVAANLESEILIIDEVLAVGDALFQKKCLSKMEQVGKDGRTVLFVSHNMAAIEALCTRAVQIGNGEVISQGNVREQIESYLKSVQRISDVSFVEDTQLGPNLTLREFVFIPSSLTPGRDQQFKITISAKQPDRINSIVVLIHSVLGQRVAIIDLRGVGCPLIIEDNPLKITGHVQSVPFIEGDYYYGLYVDSKEATGDFAHLAKISVTGQLQATNIVPYPTTVRGFVELGFDAQVVTRLPTDHLQVTNATV